MTAWFRTREVVPGVWLVAEPSHVNSWLIAGRDRAVLLDTGLGIAPIRPVVEPLARVPVGVVNTHYHFDHVGGNQEFDEIVIHGLGADALDIEWPPAVLEAYAGYIRRVLGAAETYRKLDREFFHLLSADSDPVALPPEFDSKRWRIEPSQPTGTLTDGDVIDLGGRRLTVLHTPGHTPDGISLLDEHEGLLFGGDTINTGPLYAHFADSDLAQFGASARRLAELEDSLRLVLVHHFGRVASEPSLLREIADGFERVAGDEAELAPAADCLGGRCFEARFERFSILVPDPSAPLPPIIPDTTSKEVESARD
ncbi:MAG TPA: MBL fold metallo-hydrolase [Thermoleophilaceae bacterium]|nr:MBL fold metallo-hydrolase [Thermoleophilaceae bacterium]